MNPPELLRHLEAQGLTLTLTPGNGLAASPKRLITPELADRIRQHKPALIAALQARQAQPDPEDVREFYAERAAIMEHDGGLPRPEAEAQALHLACVRFQLHQREGGGYVVAPGKTIAEVIDGLKARYSNRLESTHPTK